MTTEAPAVTAPAEETTPMTGAESRRPRLRLRAGHVRRAPAVIAAAVALAAAVIASTTMYRPPTALALIASTTPVSRARPMAHCPNRLKPIGDKLLQPVTRASRPVPGPVVMVAPQATSADLCRYAAWNHPELGSGRSAVREVITGRALATITALLDGDSVRTSWISEKYSPHPAGSFIHCPMITGEATRITFHYRDRRDIVVDVHDDGCQFEMTDTLIRHRDYDLELWMTRHFPVSCFGTPDPPERCTSRQFQILRDVERRVRPVGLFDERW